MIARESGCLPNNSYGYELDETQADCCLGLPSALVASVAMIEACNRRDGLERKTNRWLVSEIERTRLLAPVSVLEWPGRGRWRSLFFARRAFPNKRGTRMKSVHRATIWRELLWGAVAIALMSTVFLFVYLPA